MKQIIVLTLVSTLFLAACAQQQQPQQSGQSSARPASDSDRYNRDRETCRRVADDYMKRRRNIDDSTREVYQGNSDRYGQGALPSTMAAYGDTRSTDKLIASCMESRGYAQPSKTWWEKIGG